MDDSADTKRLREELGFQRWEAIGHFLTEGDYLGFNIGDYSGAIAEYEKAWNILFTPWQKKIGGSDILLGIADFALRSGKPDVAAKILCSLSPIASEFGHTALLAEIEKLKQLAGSG